MKRYGGRRVVAIMTMAFPAAALAQSPAGSEVELPVITVEGQVESEIDASVAAAGPVDGYVATTTATGSKTPLPLSRIPQSVSVVGRQELEDRGVVTKVDEALRYTPGVTAEPYGSDPDTDWLYIRGFQATQTGVFLDGLTLFSYGFGGFQVDAFMLERTEVLRGPASALYGGSNPGGIVNMVSRRPVDVPFGYVEAGVNNFGNVFTGVDVGAPLGEDGVWSYRLTAKAAGGDNYTDYSNDKRGFVLPQITYSPDDRTRITAYALVSALDQVHTSNGFLPYEGTVVDAGFGRIDRKAFFGEPDIDDGHYEQYMVGYEASHALENGWTLTSNGRFGHLYKHEQGPYPYGYVGGVATPPDYLLNRIGFEATSHVNAFAMDNRAQRTFTTGVAEHDFVAGLDYKYYQLDHVQACCGATPISAVDPVYGVPQGANFVYLDQDLTQQQTGLYAQDQIAVGKWIATVNARYDYVSTDSDATVGTSYDSTDSAVSGRAGLAYEMDNGVTPYISAATFFNPVIGVNPDMGAFEPEDGVQYEAGVKYQPDFVDGLFTAAVFQLTKDNVVTAIPGTFLQDQLGQVRSTGVELEGKVNVNENLSLVSGYTYVDLEITEDPDSNLVGNTPFLVPNSTASLWADYTITQGTLSGLGFGAGVRYVGKSWADNENLYRVPSATVFDAAVRYRINDWQASLNVSNLADKEYVRGCGGYNVCGYGDPRTITFKISKDL